MADRRVPIDNQLALLRYRRAIKDPLFTQGSSKVYRLLERNRENPGHLTLVSQEAWERLLGRPLKAGRVAVFIDGDTSNEQRSNLCCIKRSEFVAWLKIVRDPIEYRIYELEQEVMSLDTSEAVKKELLKILEQLTDTNQAPDITRQRAVCETVATLVALLKVEVAYIRAIEGDGVVPFLEGPHKEAIERQQATRQRLFPSGPAADHPWRGLGERRDR